MEGWLLSLLRSSCVDLGKSLTSLCLKFSICKMGMTIVPTCYYEHKMTKCMDKRLANR